MYLYQVTKLLKQLLQEITEIPRHTKLVGNRLFLLGMSLFSEELMSWKNSWLQSYYRGNFRGTFVFEEKRPATKVTSISEELCLRNVFNFLKKL